MNTQKQIGLIVVLFFMLVGGCAAYSAIDLPYRSGIQEDYMVQESVTRGALLFANNCRNCHGIQGQGGVGLPLNKPAFQDQDPLKLKANRELLTRTLTCGRAGTLMQPWLNRNGGALNDRQIQHIVNLITSPPEGGQLDEEGKPISKGWEEAIHFAHNLNHETIAIVSGDTLDTIAAAHAIGPKILADYNGLSVDSLITRGMKLKIPPTAKHPKERTYEVFNTNETITKVAANQKVGAAAIADLNGLDYKLDRKKGTFQLLLPDGAPVAGLFPTDRLKLPPQSVYITRAEDTVEEIAALHSVAVQAILSLNGEALKGKTEPLEGGVVLKIPDAAVYVVQGQSLKEVAQGYSNVNAEALAKTNGLSPDSIIAVGQGLRLPPDAWGSAPADTRNPGTACIQHAVPPSVFQTLPGVGTPQAEPTPAAKPTEVSKEVVVEANANDWTVVADGKKQDPNLGAVLVSSGTVVKFVNKEGVHTVTVNGAKQGTELIGAVTRDVTFRAPPDTFKITCDFHPAMKATIFVQ